MYLLGLLATISGKYNVANVKMLLGNSHMQIDFDHGGWRIAILSLPVSFVMTRGAHTCTATVLWKNSAFIMFMAFADCQIWSMKKKMFFVIKYVLI